MNSCTDHSQNIISHRLGGMLYYVNESDTGPLLIDMHKISHCLKHTHPCYLLRSTLNQVGINAVEKYKFEGRRKSL